MNIFKIKSYAKINLSLNVVGKTSALHKIESLISFVELHDLIYIKLTNKKNHKIVFKGKFSKDIKKINTVSAQLKLLDKKKLLKNQKFEIKIIKNIPPKSGMGGGSMNAASLIKFFMEKKLLKIKKNELPNITKLIGSDVILGLNPVDTILLANGKIKKFMKNSKFHTLIVKPSYGCSTKYIYSKVNKFTKNQYNIPNKMMFKSKYLIKQNNDLEKIAFHKYPKLKRIKFFLLTMPSITFVRMSGSGSSIVAYFQSKKPCIKAHKIFKKKFNSHWCITSKTI